MTENIGKAIALSLAKQDINVFVCDYNRENAKQANCEIQQQDVNALTAVCDVRDRKVVVNYVKEAMKIFEKIDILVKNSSNSVDLLKKTTKFVDAKQETLDFAIDVNLKGTINVASIAGICGIVDRVDYPAA